MVPAARAGSPFPLAELLDLLARRYALALFWALRAGPLPLRSLARSSGAAASVASQRLRELRNGGLVEVSESGEYRLSSTGRRLQGVLEPLDDFAGSWSSLTARARLPRGAPDRGDVEPDGGQPRDGGRAEPGRR